MNDNLISNYIKHPFFNIQCVDLFRHEYEITMDSVYSISLVVTAMKAFNISVLNHSTEFSHEGDCFFFHIICNDVINGREDLISFLKSFN